MSPKPTPRTIHTGLTQQGAFDAVASILRGQGYGVGMHQGKCQVYLRGKDEVLSEGDTWDETVGKLLAEVKTP